MARPSKPDLEYFPLDTNVIHDRKIRKLINKQGSDGFLVYITILCEVYRDKGYYIDYDEDLCFHISDQLPGISEEKVEEILNYCISINLFDSTLYETRAILTSVGIQRRYDEIIKKFKKRIVRIDEKYFLLQVSSEEKDITSEETGITSEENPVSSEETVVNSAETGERKGKEKKGKEIKINSLSISEKQRVGFLELFVIEKNYEPEEADRFVDHYSKSAWLDKNGNYIYDKFSAARTWEQKNKKNFLNESMHVYWTKIWAIYKEKLGILEASHLLLTKPQLTDGKLTLVCSTKVKEKCEANLQHLQFALRSILGNHIQLHYKVHYLEDLKYSHELQC